MVPADPLGAWEGGPWGKGGEGGHEAAGAPGGGGGRVWK